MYVHLDNINSLHMCIKEIYT